MFTIEGTDSQDRFMIQVDKDGLEALSDMIGLPSLPGKDREAYEHFDSEGEVHSELETATGRYVLPEPQSYIYRGIE